MMTTTTNLHRAAEGLLVALHRLAEAVEVADGAVSEVIGYGPDSSALVDAISDLMPPTARIADVIRAMHDVSRGNR